MAKITSPVEGFTGVVVGVNFTDGIAETDNAAAIAYFERQRYTVEASAEAESGETAPAEGSKDALKQKAAALGLAVSGSKADLEKRIAEHEAEQASNGNAGEGEGDKPEASADGGQTGSVREV